ncbi:MAG: cation transporter [Hydrogenophilaceae bacterium]|nr:cation transporter [Hydrogenophilaceae bacterium]
MAHTHFEHHGSDHNQPHSHTRHEHHAYGWALLLTLGFAVVEAITGWWSGSLALLSDAGHMLTDSLSLLLAGVATWLAQRPPSEKHSYGLARLEILAALVNSLFMLAIVGGIAYEAIDRYQHPEPVNGKAVMLVALIGLLINLGVGWLLTRGEDSLNRRAALVHVMGDALGSIAALTAGLVISLTGWLPIDPILSIVVAMLILVSTLNLLREALHVLMEGVPGNISLNEVGNRLARLDGVTRVHDLHIWTLASGQIAISAHLNLRDLSAWPRILSEAREVLNHDFGIGHVTLQPEVAERAPIAFHARHE